ncbi:MAG: hypothetical protein Q9163_002403 [Psora crenata]
MGDHGLGCFKRYSSFSNNIHCCGLQSHTPPGTSPTESNRFWDHADHSLDQSSQPLDQPALSPRTRAEPSAPTVRTTASSSTSLNEPAETSKTLLVPPEIPEMGGAPTPAMELLTLIRTRSNHCRRSHCSAEKVIAVGNASLAGLDGHGDARPGWETESQSDAPTTVIFCPESDTNDDDCAVSGGNTAPGDAVVDGEEEGRAQDAGSRQSKAAAENIVRADNDNPRQDSAGIGDSAIPSGSQELHRKIDEVIDNLEADINRRRKRHDEIVAALEEEREQSARWSRLKRVTGEKIRKTRSLFARDGTGLALQRYMCEQVTDNMSLIDSRQTSHVKFRRTSANISWPLKPSYCADTPAAHAARLQRPLAPPKTTRTYLPPVAPPTHKTDHNLSLGGQVESDPPSSTAVVSPSTQRNVSGAGIQSSNVSTIGDANRSHRWTAATTRTANSSLTSLTPSPVAPKLMAFEPGSENAPVRLAAQEEAAFRRGKVYNAWWRRMWK